MCQLDKLMLANSDLANVNNICQLKISVISTVFKRLPFTEVKYSSLLFFGYLWTKLKNGLINWWYTNTTIFMTIVQLSWDFYVNIVNKGMQMMTCRETPMSILNHLSASGRTKEEAVHCMWTACATFLTSFIISNFVGWRSSSPFPSQSDTALKNHILILSIIFPLL